MQKSCTKIQVNFSFCIPHKKITSFGLALNDVQIFMLGWTIALRQGCLNLLVDGHCPAEFSLEVFSESEDLDYIASSAGFN